MPKKGFTIIELLIVIAIIAILGVTIILALNPIELLKQSRDATRLSDMANLKSAIALYLGDVPYPNLGTPGVCYLDFSVTTTTLCSGGSGNWGFSSSATSVNMSASVAMDGTGWLPVNFSALGTGAPFGMLPTDPTNNGTYFYAYIPGSAGTSTFKLVTRMESKKYSAGGIADIETRDGGNSPDYYETGTGPGL